MANKSATFAKGGPSTSGMARRDGVPSDVALLYEFANTLDLRSFVRHGRRHPGGDEIDTREALRAWLLGRRLIGRNAKVSQRDHQLALDLRAGLRAGFDANSGRKVSSGLRQINDSIGALALRVVFSREGIPVLATARDTTRDALARLISEALAAIGSGQWRRLKLCAAPDCRFAFYDHSRPATGRWCTHDACGNRHNTTTYRRRRSTKPRSARTSKSET